MYFKLIIIISSHFVLTVVNLVQFLNCCITFGRYCIYVYSIIGTWNRFNRAYRGAIAALRGVNGDSGKEKTVVEEHRSNFSKRKRGLSAVFFQTTKVF